ncbi:hypothetical protein Q4508_00760 [Amphritea sp. 2_MG-2023]|uniref:hypothetical protein n=1 Tax=Amphritea TaxID=515417 RepID=UPI001C0655EC|nr:MULTISPECIES: hypothetical protein [Amphritea]MBU2964686.1 hypothetical protein [Amphritea atlantica]MDO6417084.1 hypothetical protein [Amphritea sp. 2_MG-2023]
MSFANRTIDISASCIIVIGINDAIHSSSAPYGESAEDVGVVSGGYGCSSVLVGFIPHP